MKQILKISPDVATGHCDSQGNPLLYTCALYNNLPIAFLLLDHGADPHTSNLNGLSAFDIATAPWKTAISERLSRREARRGEEEGLQYLTVRLRKTAAGIGLKLGKNPNGQAIIVGFTSPSKALKAQGEPEAGQETMSGTGTGTGRMTAVVSPAESLRVCDLIHSIDGAETRDLSEVVRKVRECGVHDVLDITVKRTRGGGGGRGSDEGSGTRGAEGLT
jgi:hypothetical protein